MKKIIVMICVLANMLSYAQKNCTTPLSNSEFQVKFNEIMGQKEEPARLDAAMKMVKDNCLLVAQVKQIAEKFQYDYNRLEFAKAAFGRTTDKVNFYEVYDSFQYFSSVFKLHDFVTSNKDGKVEQKPDKIELKPVEVKAPIQWIAYQYPDASKYTGDKKCQQAISENDFNKTAMVVFNEKTDDAKYKECINICQTKCISTAQVMKLCQLIPSERVRLDFMKTAYVYIFDIANFDYAKQVLTDKRLKEELVEFIKSQQAPQLKPTTKPCMVDPTDFAEIKGQIEKQSFNNTKVNTFKTVVPTRKCFSIDQMIEMLNLFSFENDKIELAKFAYDYIKEGENYIKLNDIFSFDSNKNAWMDFLKTKKK